MTPSLLSVERASLRRGGQDPILHDVSLDLAPGSFHFVVGPAVPAKSSLLRLLSLQAPPAGGRMTMFGQDACRLRGAALAAARRRIGVVHQELRLLEHLCAVDNVSLPLRIAGTAAGEARRRPGALLDWLGIGQLGDAMPEPAVDRSAPARGGRPCGRRQASLLRGGRADEPSGRCGQRAGDASVHGPHPARHGCRGGHPRARPPAALRFAGAQHHRRRASPRRSIWRLAG